MSDYHAELERHLREAARRRARLRGLAVPRAGIVLAVAASVAAVLVAVVVGLSSLGGEPEREVAAPGAGAAGCDSGKVPVELHDAFGLLRGPRSELASLQDDVREAVDQDLPGPGRPQHVFSEEARPARGDGDPRLWSVPVCDSDGKPAMCFVLIDREARIPSCGSVAEAREGRLLFNGALGEGEWFLAALLPDMPREAIGIRGIDHWQSTFEGNVFYATYRASIDDHERARLVVGGQQGAGCGEPVATQDPAPATIVDRIAVLRQDPDPPTDFELDHPDVRTIYAGSTRIAKFGSGADAFVVPVLLGKCVNPQPGVCLVPMTRGFETACGQLTGGAGDPFAVYAIREEAGETDVIGVTGDSVRAVDVIHPLADGSTTSLRVDVEGGTFTATVAEADGDVTVKPAG